MLRQIADIIEDSREQKTLLTTLDSDSDAGDADMPHDYDPEMTSDYYSSNNGSGGQYCSQSSTINSFNSTGAPSSTDNSNL